MATVLPPPPPHGAPPPGPATGGGASAEGPHDSHHGEPSEVGFFSRHATGLTLATFLAVSGALGAAPGVPDWARPIDLADDASREAALARVFKKPKMTFAAWSQKTGDDDEGEGETGEAPADEGPDEVDTDSPDTPTEPDPAELVAEAPPEPGKPFVRKLKTASKTAQWLRKRGKQLGAPGALIDNPCVKQAADGSCERTALDPFFAALDAVAQKEAGAHATVVTLGNSLIASDHVTDIVRERLVERFGDGGRGYLLTDRTSKVAGRRVRTGYGSKTWKVNTFAQRPPDRPLFGFAGSSHESTRAGDKTVWTLMGADTGRLFYLDHPAASPFTLAVDGTVIATITPDASAPTDKIFDFDLPEGGKKLTLTAEGPEVVIFGVALEKNAPGVTWDTLGVPASDSQIYVEKTNPDIFMRQLGARAPDLLVPMVGGNETRSLAFKWTTPEEVRGYYGRMIDLMRQSAPDAACLAVAPIDAAKATAAGAKLTTRPQLLEVVAIEKEVAREKGCAYFNLFEAMGGEGSLQRFRRAGYVHDDLVHPKGKGGDILGQLFADALMQAWVDTPLPKEPVKAKRRLVPPRMVALTLPKMVDDAEGVGAIPMLKMSDALTDAASRRDRFAVLHIGDEASSSETFTNALRKGFFDRAAPLGRGLVPAGHDDKALRRTAVKRRLIGNARIQDGRDVVVGGAMGIGGSRVRLSPSSRFDITFCHGCKNAVYIEPGFLEVAWLYTPDMGTAEVLVNNVQVGELSVDSRRRLDTDVQYLRIPVRGSAHEVSVIVKPDSEGPVNVFSVSQELAKPGVIVDGVALAGTTGMTMQRWRQELFGDQVLRRDYDLIVAAWGSHESDLEQLDETTYRHHLTSSLQTLRDHAPDAACVVMGPVGKREAARVELVRTVQKVVAADLGCAYFDPDKVLPASPIKLQKAGLQKRGELTSKGKRVLADALLADLMSWHDYAQLKKAQELARAEEAAALARAKARDAETDNARERIELAPIDLTTAAPEG
jgi:hypothetical protein